MKSEALILKKGKHTLNEMALYNAAANTDWSIVDGKLRYNKSEPPEGTGKPIETEEQVFILKKRLDNLNAFLHDAPGLAMEREELPVFDDYDTAMKHARNFSNPVSVWQYCKSKFELIHHYVGGIKVISFPLKIIGNLVIQKVNSYFRRTVSVEQLQMLDHL